jgi:exosortase A-associated hydrolase 2
MMPNGTEQHVTLRSDGAGLYAMGHEPAGPARGTVVICNPMFEERKSAQVVLVAMSRVLCGDGWRVLRFDYRGCGDSPGAFRDFTPSDWVDDVRSAVEACSAATPAAPVTLLGLRMGAALAVRAALTRRDVGAVVLWEPVVSGRDYLEQELRKMLVKEMVTFGRSRISRAVLVKELEEGREIDFDGYPVSPLLYRGLCAIDGVRDAERLRRPLLLVHATHQERASAAIQTLHTALRAANPDGTTFRIVKQQPFWNLIGFAEFSALIDVTREWVNGTGGKLSK